MRTDDKRSVYTSLVGRLGLIVLNLMSLKKSGCPIDVVFCQVSLRNLFNILSQHLFLTSSLFKIGGGGNNYGNSGYGNSGYGNSGHGNSGYGNNNYGNSGHGGYGGGYGGTNCQLLSN